MTQTDPSQQTVAPPLEAPPRTTSRMRDRLFYALIAAIILAAVAILGYTALRPVKTPGTPGPLPSADTRAADEAAALDTLQKVDAASAVAARNLTVDGSGLELLVSSSVLDHERQFYQTARDQGLAFRGESVPTHKVRGYTVNVGDVRVTLATCTDLRNVKYVVDGREQPALGPAGKPADWIFRRAELTKQDNGTWLLTSDQALTGGPTCSLDAPF